MFILTFSLLLPPVLITSTLVCLRTGSPSVSNYGWLRWFVVVTEVMEDQLNQNREILQKMKPLVESKNQRHIAIKEELQFHYTFFRHLPIQCVFFSLKLPILAAITAATNLGRFYDRCFSIAVRICLPLATRILVWSVLDQQLQLI